MHITDPWFIMGMIFRSQVLSLSMFIVCSKSNGTVLPVLPDSQGAD